MGFSVNPRAVACRRGEVEPYEPIESENKIVFTLWVDIEVRIRDMPVTTVS